MITRKYQNTQNDGASKGRYFLFCTFPTGPNFHHDGKFTWCSIGLTHHRDFCSGFNAVDRCYSKTRFVKSGITTSARRTIHSVLNKRSKRWKTTIRTRRPFRMFTGCKSSARRRARLSTTANKKLLNQSHIQPVNFIVVQT